MVQIKAAASLFIAAAAVAPALAQSYYYADNALVTREDLEELADILARDYGYDIEARDFDDVNELDARELYDELFERDPMFGINHAKKLWHHFTGKGKKDHEHEGFHHEHQGRLGEHHSLHEHHGEFGHHHGGFAAGGSPDASAAAAAPPPTPADPSQYGRRSYDDMDELDARDYDELFERDPMFGVNHAKKLWHHFTGNGKKNHEHEGFHHEHEGLHQGHLGEHHEHHGQFGHHHGGFATGGGSPDASAAAPPPPPVDPSQNSRRSYDDMEEFEARDVQPEYEELLTRYFDDLYERELAAEDEYTALAARSFEGDDFAELVQRSPEPNIIEWFKNLFHHHKKGDKKDKKDKKDDKKGDDKKDDKDSKDKSTTTDSTKTSDKTTDKDDASVESREFDDFWYDLD